MKFLTLKHDNGNQHHLQALREIIGTILCFLADSGEKRRKMVLLDKIFFSQWFDWDWV